MEMPNLGEMLIILFIVLLVFGAAKMPALGDAVGRALLQLRRAAQDRPSGDRGDARRA
jgi:sec-independent protein translocase protein TatA